MYSTEHCVAQWARDHYNVVHEAGAKSDPTPRTAEWYVFTLVNQPLQSETRGKAKPDNPGKYSMWHLRKVHLNESAIRRNSGLPYAGFIF